MTSRDFFDRYGIALGTLAVLALVLVILPGNVDERTVDTGFGTGDLSAAPGDDPFASPAPVSLDEAGQPLTTDAGGVPIPGAASTTIVGGAPPATVAGGAPAPTVAGSGGSTATTRPASTSATGPAVQFGTGPNCRTDGKQKGISFYMPPCVSWDGSSNGGKTFNGVTNDKITIVRYLPELDPATRGILQGAGLSDSEAAVKNAYNLLFRYSNLHYETYGRQVEFVDVKASGASESEEAMRADALRIANDIKPFAVIEGDPAAPMPTVLTRELAQRGVLCICTTSLTSSFYTSLPPALWSSLPTSDEYAAQAAEYIGKKLAFKPAQFAGDDKNPTQGYRTKERVFGLIYLNGARGKVDPEGERVRQAFERELAKYGVAIKKSIGYIYDPGRNSQDVTNLIATMKGEGVTTIIPAWDPLYPILLTQEATRQQYFPEWMIVGTGLSDTTTAGRLYDQQQWSQAFGISPLWVTWATVAASSGGREYAHGRMASDNSTEPVLINIYRARIETLFRGIHMAGPTLNNDSFVRGLINTPPTGGTPGLPLRFMTRQFPTEIKDFVEVWYSATDSGPDEREQSGQGVIWKANNGKRFQIGAWTNEPSRAFQRDAIVHVSDTPEGGGDPAHEQDGHKHPDGQKCLSCR